MSNHAIRFKCSTSQKSNPSNVPAPEPPELPNVVPDRVQQNVAEKFEEVLPEQASEASLMNAEIDGSGTDYIQGIRRFSSLEDKLDIVNELESGVVADTEWYVIESHVCNHDENSRSGCGGWTVEVEKGDVPNDV